MTDAPVHYAVTTHGDTVHLTFARGGSSTLDLGLTPAQTARLIRRLSEELQSVLADKERASGS